MNPHQFLQSEGKNAWHITVMFAPEVLDEVMALKSIFCNPKEFFLVNPTSFDELEESSGPISFKISVSCVAGEDLNTVGNKSPVSLVVEMTVVISQEYPRKLPQISLSCAEMSRKDLNSLRKKLLEYINDWHSSSSEPMIMELVMWLQENTKDFLCSDNISTASKSASGNLCADKTVILLKIDHMRSKNRYIKTITRWVQELNLSGRLFFVSSLIFLLLAGKDSDVREYLRRHKTCNVDVDSSGKPCKERMMNVLVQEQAPSKLR